MLPQSMPLAQYSEFHRLACGCFSRACTIRNILTSTWPLSDAIEVFGATNGLSNLLTSTGLELATSGDTTFFDIRDAERLAAGLPKLPGFERVIVEPRAVPEIALRVEIMLGASISKESLLFALYKFGSIVALVFEVGPWPGRVCLCVFHDSRHARAAAGAPLFVSGVNLKTSVTMIDHVRVCPTAAAETQSSMRNSFDLFTPTIADSVASPESPDSFANSSRLTTPEPFSMSPTAINCWDHTVPGFSNSMFSYPSRAGGLWTSSSTPGSNSEPALNQSYPKMTPSPGLLPPFVPGARETPDVGSHELIKVAGIVPGRRIVSLPSVNEHACNSGIGHASELPRKIGFNELGSPLPDAPELMSPRTPFVTPPQTLTSPPDNVASPMTPASPMNPAPVAALDNLSSSKAWFTPRIMMAPFVKQPKSVSQQELQGVSAKEAAEVDVGPKQVSLSDISTGKETRTTIMLRNIPNKVDQHGLEEFLNATNKYTYDFVYLRMDFTNKCNVGYAFISFTHPRHIATFVKARQGKKWSRHNSDKVIAVTYANVQGSDALVQKFRNSPVMKMEEAFRPKLYYTKGPRAGSTRPFPAPNGEHVPRA